MRFSLASLEVGGFFPWHDDLLSAGNGDDSSPLVNDDVLCFSGQAALGLVLEDLQVTYPHIPNVAYVPSYCCESMLRPFRRYGFELLFYDVWLDPEIGLRYEIDSTVDCGVFLAVSYFGFGDTVMDPWIEEFSHRGICTVEDITHRFLSRHPFSNSSTYAFASLRKWVGVASGGLARGLKSVNKGPRRDGNTSVTLGDRAMRSKFDYLESGCTDQVVKSEYLETWGNHERVINDESWNRGIDDRSREVLQCANYGNIRTSRVSNARYLHEALSEMDMRVGPSENLDWENDCPLFLPIFVKASQRDELASFLRSNGVYAPVHWPKPEGLVDREPVPAGLSPYLTEISIPIDHRYGIRDMDEVGLVVREYFDKR